MLKEKPKSTARVKYCSARRTGARPRAPGCEARRGFENLRADLVLPAVAAGRRRERGPIALPAVQHHQQTVVLIVGMGGRVKEDASVGQVPQREAKRNVAFFFVERGHPQLRARNRQRRKNQRG